MNLQTQSSWMKLTDSIEFGSWIVQGGVWWERERGQVIIQERGADDFCHCLQPWSPYIGPKRK